MEKIYYNKLCRDRIPDIIRDKGYQCEVRTLDHDEFKREITRKVYEEASGVSNHASRDELLRELADLHITVQALKREFDVTDSEMTEAITKSLVEKGGFDRRTYLAWSSDVEYNTVDRPIFELEA